MEDQDTGTPGGLTDAEAAERDARGVVVPHLDDVRGNLTLPTSGAHGTELTWSSSVPEVVTTTGEVSRPAHDRPAVTVELTVTATRGDARHRAVHVATVRPLPAPLHLAGYFFPFFKGESTPTSESLYFALSQGDDPLTWQALNGDRPVLRSTLGERGLRDPFVLRSHEGDRFFMLATDLNMHGLYDRTDFGRAQESGSTHLVIWESTDLVHWSEPRMVKVSSDLAGNTWAPEACYDERTGEYVVYWASNLYPTADVASRSVRDSYNRMMYATTRDFVTFSEPRVWVDVRRGTGRGMIDVSIVRLGDTFHRFIKDEASMTVRQERSTDLTATVTGSLPTATSSPWQLVTEHIGVGQPNPWGGTFTGGEGPTAFRDNRDPDRWYLFIDQPDYHGGEGYMSFQTDDIASGSWTASVGAQLPVSPRHGTVLPITRAEYDALLRAYGPDASVGSTDVGESA